MGAPLRVRQRAVAELRLAPDNARTHDERQIAALARSIQEYGFVNPVLVDAHDEVIAGHGRLAAAQQLGMARVPTIVLADLTPAQARAYRLADNRLALDAGWDVEALERELGALRDLDFDLALTGFDDQEITSLLAPVDPAASAETLRGRKLTDEFGILPVSVLRTDREPWLGRKREWKAHLALDVANLGRPAGIIFSGDTIRDPVFYKRKREYEARIGRELSTDEFRQVYRPPVKQGPLTVGTSQFDPVLAECATQWYTAPGDLIVDPFAGDVERGLVAGRLGRRYRGIEVRPEQVVRNTQLAFERAADHAHPPEWACLDAATADAAAAATLYPAAADLVFTCPPYWRLERYSDDPNDLSAMPEAEFWAAYERAFRTSWAALREDRFAVWVVGECRRGDGTPLRLADRTIEIALGAGARLHDEVILATVLAGKGVMIRNGFGKSRRILPAHEYVIVFCKGDPFRACERLEPVALPDLAAEEDEAAEAA